MTSAPAHERVELPISGMTCASCARRVEKRLNRLEGVEASDARTRGRIAHNGRRPSLRRAAMQTTPRLNCCRPRAKAGLPIGGVSGDGTDEATHSMWPPRLTEK
jgi:cation transport ATPase